VVMGSGPDGSDPTIPSGGMGAGRFRRRCSAPRIPPGAARCKPAITSAFADSPLNGMKDGEPRWSRSKLAGISAMSARLGSDVTRGTD